MTCEKVLSCWNRSFPNDPSPYVWLNSAKQIMQGKQARNEGEIMRDQADNYCGELVCKYQELQNDIAVGYATLQVVRIALWDNLYPKEVDQEVTDGDLDPDDLDYAYCAAVAWASGTIWNGSSSNTKRLKFWRWWLTEAVAAAWYSQPAN
jgi:hypothetical protein